MIGPNDFSGKGGQFGDVRIRIGDIMPTFCSGRRMERDAAGAVLWQRRKRRPGKATILGLNLFRIGHNMDVKPSSGQGIGEPLIVLADSPLNREMLPNQANLRRHDKRPFPKKHRGCSIARPLVSSQMVEETREDGHATHNMT